MFDRDKYKEIKDFLQKNHKKSQIIAVSKNHPRDSVISALKSGAHIFGENRVIEAKNKFAGLRIDFPKIELHLTGPLQSNKVKMAVNLFDVFHTLDREKIANEFSKYQDILKNKKIFVQVNTGEEKTKSGVTPKELKDFLNYCKYDKGLNIIGLMCIPPINDKPKTHFKLIETLAKENNVNELSIGMSNDYSDAIEFNPTYIRLGTILFGNRHWKIQSKYTPILKIQILLSKF